MASDGVKNRLTTPQTPVYFAASNNEDCVMTIIDTYKAPAHRNPVAKALADRRFARRIVRPRKGRGSYRRKNGGDK